MDRERRRIIHQIMRSALTSCFPFVKLKKFLVVPIPWSQPTSSHEMISLSFFQLLKNRAGNDMFVERGMQTYNNAPKQKEAQTSYVGKEVCSFAFFLASVFNQRPLHSLLIWMAIVIGTLVRRHAYCLEGLRPARSWLGLRPSVHPSGNSNLAWT